MKYGDFASIVQLGAGLHVGTALLQLYGDLGLQPLVRTIARIRSLSTEETSHRAVRNEEDLTKLESDFEIFKIQLFHEYKKYVQANSIVAVILVMILVSIAYNADSPVDATITVVIIAISILPGPLTLGILWFDAGHQSSGLMKRADTLEKRALTGK